MYIPVTAAAVGFFGLLHAGLTLPVAMGRLFMDVHYGLPTDASKSKDFEHKVRAQVNNSEHAPIGLLILAALEANKARSRPAASNSPSNDDATHDQAPGFHSKPDHSIIVD
ncbi:MAPEG family [Haematococcus lacustris]|uniref:MAPEG family n=1 Tax=Haematococcus lacustris TaxID=44745 RepID=A0A6A0A291_HAELA|nr:MAPEG family [Haematococcus lacustris]